MHELSIAESLVDIIRQEMEKHGVTTLHKVEVVVGQLTAIVPEALEMSFTALTVDTPLAGAVITTEIRPLTVCCRECKKDFSPAEDDPYLMTCPFCGAEIGHEVLTGRELFISNIVAE
ncbi:MAG: hydrogenase maturation nickel metallochaperone HypA [Deltaproteobacteria bacterium]|nr:hydrogenase maturation nickel metallochaperone HypA [Deltaproteobacteria bacterium]